MAALTAGLLWLERLSRMTMSPGPGVGQSCSSTPLGEAGAIDRLIEHEGRIDRSQRSAAMQVIVFQWPSGTLA